MQPLTDEGRLKVDELAGRYGVSSDAVMALLQALLNGNGTMAQFYHPDLGGGGQWMRGGMTMVSDLFNHALKAKVDGLCNELSDLLARQPFVQSPPVSSWQSQSQGGQQSWQGGSGNAGAGASLFVPPPAGSSGNWWPDGLGFPNATGAQNNIRYAYFAGPRRLAVEINGQVTVYDTGDHQIGGVSQQQGYGSSLTFSSQYGTVPLASLPMVSDQGSAPPPPPQSQAPEYPSQSYQELPAAGSGNEADIFQKIERLAELERKGILSQEEFAAKKSELLSRL